MVLKRKLCMAIIYCCFLMQMGFCMFIKLPCSFDKVVWWIKCSELRIIVRNFCAFILTHCGILFFSFLAVFLLVMRYSRFT